MKCPGGAIEHRSMAPPKAARASKKRSLEQHGGRTFEGVTIRITQRTLAMATAIWHNYKAGAPVTRSLIAYD